MFSLVLLGALIILLILYVRLRQDIRYLRRQISRNSGEFHSLRIRGMNRDVEELAKEMNQILEVHQKEKVTFIKKDEKLRQSLTGLSHDLRTPLTSIKGYLQLIQEGNLTIEKNQHYLNVVQGRTDYLQEMMTTFYDLCRIEDKEYPFQFERLDLRQILTESLLLFYEELKEKEIEPHVSMGSFNTNLVADIAVVRRVFVNILTNMIRYGEPPFEVRVEEYENGFITRFINKAPHVNEEHLVHIFDRFYQIDSARTSRSSGLGLSITKEFVEQMGHEIWAELENDHLVITIYWKVETRRN